ncbi:hypothetical protein DL546_000102 [Coniochaeta pulveracea]|uniref:Chromo domain-containing protein n=1 Tax=Coniochaeta pulveracea TaxID=177199 RepID=A0A420XWN7_9PEZI|nr:hypothetical protein DL546_000102 [Coniochaeta pulveracea]
MAQPARLNTKRVRTRPVKIDIPLASKPKRLYRSDCLPPPRISLVPPRDTTAYIVAKYVMPPLIRNKAKYIEEPGIRRNMYYTVGWRDKPLAKVVVCANEIMTYVSPRELEDFEYREYLAAEEERARLAAPAAKPKGKRGRPRKGPAAAVEAAELARLMELPNISITSEEELGADKKVGGPSLSTPSKKGLIDAPEIGDSEFSTGEDEATVGRQLHGRLEDALSLDAEAHAGYYPAAQQKAKRKRQKSNEDEQSTPKAGAGPQATASAAAPPAKPKPKAPQRSTKPATPNQLPPSQSVNDIVTTPQLQAELSSQISGFTPLQRTHSLSQPAVSALSTAPPASLSPTLGDQSPKRKKQKKKKLKEPTPSEDSWEVLRLEGDAVDYDANGNLVQYYRVRWKGDWPEDQNPTWEPEDNIDPELVASYLKKKEKKNGSMTRPSPSKSKTKPPKYIPKKRYSNVAEAFEGDLDELNDPAVHHERQDEEVDDGEEKFVVSEDMGAFGDFDQGLAKYREQFGPAR